jgi:hypothetical protein
MDLFTKLGDQSLHTKSVKAGARPGPPAIAPPSQHAAHSTQHNLHAELESTAAVNVFLTDEHAHPTTATMRHQAHTAAAPGHTAAVAMLALAAPLLLLGLAEAQIYTHARDVFQSLERRTRILHGFEDTGTYMRDCSPYAVACLESHGVSHDVALCGASDSREPPFFLFLLRRLMISLRALLLWDIQARPSSAPPATAQRTCSAAGSTSTRRGGAPTRTWTRSARRSR